MEFGEVLRAARAGSGLTQSQVADVSGVARPNIAAYEAGTREPGYSMARKILSAVNARIVVESPVVWGWTAGRRPYAVPSRLWRLPPGRALATITPGQDLWWSGPPRSFDLADRSDRLRAYEIVLREGTPGDIVSIVDEVLLIEAWNDLVVPADLRRAWEPLVVAGLDVAAVTASGD